MDKRITSEIPLGKTVPYVYKYDPEQLVAFPRLEKRDELGLCSDLPFGGVDIWHIFELCWLDTKGKPTMATGRFSVPATSSSIVESKSVKLYLVSFSESKFDSIKHVEQTIQKDLSRRVGDHVSVELSPVGAGNESDHGFHTMPGDCLDDQDIEADTYTVNPDLLSVEDTLVNECLYSHLLKTNCLITNQPDWGSLIIRYSGRKINRAGLLLYIISYREHNEFHEQCVERIYTDIMDRCMPNQLTVYACYSRRGGVSISPFRSNFETHTAALRLVRT